ncbi:hypothetical protein SEA_LIGMA_76 [Gordonia phage Ligma]|nr:hypothetical protein SEA_LIGMA_76 [Gordonia phage Ligma]UQT02175.1 hypothetical protein SEA_AXUMITE_76 [Gordonia phage Axumite]
MALVTHDSVQVAPDSDVTYSTSLVAFLDTRSYDAATGAPTGGSAFDRVLLPVALDDTACQHLDTVCPHCVDSWAADYDFDADGAFG